MNRFKHFLTSNVGIATSFVLAAGLLLFGSVGGARAALTYYSDNYSSQVQMRDIGITLVENGNRISNRDYFEEVADGTWDEHTGVLLAGMLPKDANGQSEFFKFGEKYEERLQVENSGTIDTYVRVTLYKYWVDKEGHKTYDMDPAIIEIIPSDNGAWTKDDSATTAERQVFYYNSKLPSGGVTPELTSAIRINGQLEEHVTLVEKKIENTNYKYWSYDYNGYQFIIEATADAVQDHNAQDAILSAWGKHVTVANDTLTLNASGAQGED
ncbi:MAG: hypothetical protein HUJ71_00725 [Pseudobutyrivibrio sp.]|nr:hypothetical protein [Pseudobutyrivibrio sp.]